MVDIEKVIQDQHKYIVNCSRCGEPFWSIVEILDVIPIICGDCNINMPIKFHNNGQYLGQKEDIND